MYRHKIRTRKHGNHLSDSKKHENIYSIFYFIFCLKKGVFNFLVSPRYIWDDFFPGYIWEEFFFIFSCSEYIVLIVTIAVKQYRLQIHSIKCYKYLKFFKKRIAQLFLFITNGYKITEKIYQSIMTSHKILG